MKITLLMRIFRLILTKKVFVLLLVIISALSVSASVKDKSTFVLVIDAGHGGKDPGAIRYKTKEKDVVLRMALALEKRLKPYHTCIKVILTRMDDRFVELNKRAEIANNAHADLFVSLHANACSSPKIFGVEVYTLGVAGLERENQVAKMENSVILMEENHAQTYADFDPFSPESYIMMTMVKDDNFNESIFFSKMINDSFSSKKVATRGVRQAGFLVLRKTEMPSVLVELGYLSNKKDCNTLKSWQGVSKISGILCESILKYLKQQGVEVVKTKEPVTTLHVENDVKRSVEVDGEYFSIQLAASSKSLSVSRFGLQSKDVFQKNNKGWFRYYYGKYKTFNDAKVALASVKRTVKDAFIVAFDAQGNKVSVKLLLGK